MQTLTSSDLVGSWRLVSHEARQSDDSWKSWGKNPRGLLIYTAEGAMSVSLNKDPEGDATKPEESFKAILFYSGRFELNPEGKVLHHVDYASDLRRVGQSLVRDAQLEGDVLTLLAEGTGGLVRVRWQRLGNSKEST